MGYRLKGPRWAGAVGDLFPRTMIFKHANKWIEYLNPAAARSGVGSFYAWNTWVLGAPVTTQWTGVNTMGRTYGRYLIKNCITKIKAFVSRNYAEQTNQGPGSPTWYGYVWVYVYQSASATNAMDFATGSLDIATIMRIQGIKIKKLRIGDTPTITTLVIGQTIQQSANREYKPTDSDIEGVFSGAVTVGATPSFGHPTTSMYLHYGFLVPGINAINVADMPSICFEVSDITKCIWSNKAINDPVN